jgi:hypothetical protein
MTLKKKKISEKEAKKATGVNFVCVHKIRLCKEEGVREIRKGGCFYCRTALSSGNV